MYVAPHVYIRRGKDRGIDAYERIVFLYFRLFRIPNSQRYQTAGA